MKFYKSIIIEKFVNTAYRRHFGKNFPETHCFRGYPYYGSILPFESSASEYIAHLDSDMLIYQEEGFDWIKRSHSNHGEEPRHYLLPTSKRTPYPMVNFTKAQLNINLIRRGIYICSKISLVAYLL